MGSRPLLTTPRSGSSAAHAIGPAILGTLPPMIAVPFLPNL